MGEVESIVWITTSLTSHLSPDGTTPQPKSMLGSASHHVVGSPHLAGRVQIRLLTAYGLHNHDLSGSESFPEVFPRCSSSFFYFHLLQWPSGGPLLSTTHYQGLDMISIQKPWKASRDLSSYLSRWKLPSKA